MPRSDLVIDLVKAGIGGDDANLRAAAEAIAADERAKNHGGVADRISRLLDHPRSGIGTAAKSQSLRTRESNSAVERRDPRFGLEALYLQAFVKRDCEELIDEQRRADVLRAHGMDPRHRLLLVGPPGNGKTSMAEALAYELSLPLFTVRYDAVVTSYLGETAQRLRRLFDQVRTEPCVLFFDEFDAIGKERGDLHETGEIKRVVTTLLLQLDDLPSYCVLVAATNHPELLDRAAWRRFELQLHVGAPTSDSLESFFADQFKRLDGNPGHTAKRLVERIDVQSFAEAERFILDVRRRAILAAGSKTLRTVVEDRIRIWSQRRLPDDRCFTQELDDDRALDTSAS